MLSDLRSARLEPIYTAGTGKRPGLFTHWGSSLVLVLGFFALIGALGSLSKGEDTSGMLVGAPSMILGALAYRSAKKRRLGEVAPSFMRRMFELTAILLIGLIVLSQNDLKSLINSDPGPYFVIPGWAVLAYLIAAVKAMKRRDMSRSIA
jgi:hypothetical protein